MRSVFSLTALMIFVMTGCSNDTADSTAQVESDASHDMHSSADGHGQEAAHSDATAHDHAHESFKLTGENTQVLFTGTKKSGDNHSGGLKAISGEITLALRNALLDIQSGAVADRHNWMHALVGGNGARE